MLHACVGVVANGFVCVCEMLACVGVLACLRSSAMRACICVHAEHPQQPMHISPAGVRKHVLASIKHLSQQQL